ncbi:MAG: hypothetical protein QME87_05625 [Bacillota bacterium]|nr:hypothetical protein [Bacillota bacterium]
MTRHLGELIQGHPRLYLLACPAGAWGTLRDGLGRQLRRTEAANPPLAVPHGWAAWRDGSGVTVISSRPHRLRGGRSTVEILAPDDALALVRSLMEALTHKSQLSTSHSWKLGRASRMIA